MVGKDKKILFVGNVNSFLIYQLAKQIKNVYPNWRIDILSETLFELDDSPFDNIYAVNHNDPKASKKIIKAFFVSNEMRKLLYKMDKDYDFVHILYLSSAYRFIWRELKSLAPNRVITVFGGDFYKSTIIMRFLMRKMVNESTIISASNPDTLAGFSNYFKVSKYNQKVVRFGLSVLDEIDSLNQKEVEEWKLRHKIQKDRILIACGYNNSPNQNLQELIQVLLQERKLLSRCILCFQFVGKETPYTREIINLLNENKVEFRVFSERFSDRELAIYRKSMNIMVQVQTTDSFSGAMQEHLYAGSLVITGKWLPYEILDNQGVDYIRVKFIDEVAQVIGENLERKINHEKNRAVIAGFSKWSKTIDSWINLYK